MGSEKHYFIFDEISKHSKLEKVTLSINEWTYRLDELKQEHKINICNINVGFISYSTIESQNPADFKSKILIGCIGYSKELSNKILRNRFHDRSCFVINMQLMYDLGYIIFQDIAEIQVNEFRQSDYLKLYKVPNGSSPYIIPGAPKDMVTGYAQPEFSTNSIMKLYEQSYRITYNHESRFERLARILER